MIYPTWRFHATQPSCIVKNAEEDAKLGPGWADSPGAAQAWADSLVPEESTPASDFYKLHWKTLAAQFERTQDVADLEMAKEIEQTNPKGPRKAVLDAIEARKTALLGVPVG